MYRTVAKRCCKIVCNFECRCISAPSSGTVSSQSISSLLIIFIPPTHVAGIDLYHAFAGSHGCKVRANISPLSCTIIGLLSSTPNTVLSMACIPNGDYCHPTFGQAFKLPDCAFVYQLCYQNNMSGK